MSSHRSWLEPTLFTTRIRFVQGYRYLDRCGDVLIQLEDELGSDWLPSEANPTGVAITNALLGMKIQLSSEFLDVFQQDFMSFEHYCDNVCKAYDIITSELGIKFIFSPAMRVLYHAGYDSTDDAELDMRALNLFVSDPVVLCALGGDEVSLNAVYITTKKISWQGESVLSRRHIATAVTQQERREPFDQRLFQRAALLAPQHRKALSGLREVRERFASPASVVAQIDPEFVLEEEFSARTFDIRGFLVEAHTWAESVKSKIEEMKRERT